MLTLNTKRLPFLGVALVLCAFCLCLTACTSAFNGSVIKNADAYMLDIQTMTGTDQHTLELKEGDVLQIQFETAKGSLSMEIKAPDGTSIYQGNGKEATEFTMGISADGIYTVSVEGRKARGSIRIDVEKKPDAQAPVTAADLVGPWHLDEEAYDEAAVNETFPGAMEFGNSMEITSDGRISWYIGADGGSGTYTLDETGLSASMTNAFDGTDMTMELALEKDGDLPLLTMDYKGLTLRWAWGEMETGKGEESKSRHDLPARSEWRLQCSLL